jgi:hypothetical protein
VAPHGGIRPAQRRRSRLALTLAEREVISRGVSRVRRQPRRKVSKKSAPSFGLSFGLILQIGSIYRVSVTLQKRGLLRPMPLLRAFAHWDHESRPTAAVFAGAIHSCQGRRYSAATSGLESRNRWPRPVLAAIQQARASCENSSNNSFTPEIQTLPVNFGDNQNTIRIHCHR